VKIHEYQAKAVLARFGVPVPRGEVAFSAAEAGEIARRLGTPVVVIKAQIHAGGRGKGGGVKIAKSPADVEQIANQMLGMTLITHQTGPEGKKVGRVLIEEGLQIDRELYLSILIDRASQAPVVIASAAGGMDIEEVAATTPERIVKEQIERRTGIIPFEARKIAFAIGLDGALAARMVKLLDAIYRTFV
jgi:succinyl-CoA synthetase beta subunit